MNSKKINLKMKLKPVSQILMIILALLISTNVFSQESKVSGIVEDGMEGGPLIGATVRIKGTTTGTITDANGNYSLTGVSPGDTLMVTYVGYLAEEVPVNNRNQIDLTLIPDVKELEQVVVIGYGTIKKSDLTGAVASVKGEEMTRAPSVSIDQALQGQAAGVQVTQSSGRPGAPVSIKIRGLGTVNNAEPLYVIDGVPIVNQIDIGGGFNSLSTLNPNDIESVEILKDASATAIYGARGANGVIMITTKRGSEGGPAKINFNATRGVSKLPKKLDLMNSAQYAQFYSDMYAEKVQENQENPDAHKAIAKAVNIYNTQSKIIDTDWQDATTHSAVSENYNVSITGGNESVNYGITGGYMNQEGIIIGSDFERYSIRANSDIKLNDRLKIGESLFASQVNQNNEELGYGNIAPTSPIMRVYNEDNLGGFAGPDTTIGRNDRTNVLATNTLNQNYRESNRILANVYGELEIIDGLTYKLNVAGDYIFGNHRNFAPRYDLGIRSKTAEQIVENRSNSRSILVENLLTYNKSIEKHNFTLLGGTTYQTYERENLSATGDTLTNPETPTVANTISRNAGYSYSEWIIISYLGRLIYSYDDKYLFTGSFRRDGSSRFGPNYRWGMFPSFSLGWRFSNESFMSTLDWLNDGKLRYSWGKTGNQEIPTYEYLSLITTNRTYYVFGQNQNLYYGGAPLLSLGNRDIRWETTIQQNFGLDLSLFNNRLLLNADYYIKDTEEMLVGVEFLDFAGVHDLATPIQNIGKIRNKGIELSLTYRNYQGEFKHSISGNISSIHNEVISLNDEVLFGIDDGETITKTEKGHTIGSFYGYIADGIFQNEDDILNHARQGGAEPGDVKFKDLNNDGTINPSDRTHIGKSIPTLIYGLNLDMAYKGFDLKVFFQGIYDVDVFNELRRNLWLPSNISNQLDFNKLVDAADYWTPENSSTEVPRISESDRNNNGRTSTLFLEDASYLRIKNLQIGYTIPLLLSQRISIQNIRIYGTALNLFTFTNYSGIEPEVGQASALDYGSQPRLLNGYDQGTFPQARTILAGIQIEF